MSLRLSWKKKDLSVKLVVREVRIDEHLSSNFRVGHGRAS